MSTAIFWVGLAIFFVFLIVGFLDGLYRGLKRSALHILFFVVSMVVAYFITKPITNALLGISIVVEGEKTTLANILLMFLSKSFDLSQYSSASTFLANLPMAVVAPLVFIIVALLTFVVFDIAYIVTARLWFKSKKQDFSKTKPYRWFGAGIGLVEGFLFMFVLFAPLSSLTNTYAQLSTSPASTTVQADDGTFLAEEGSVQKLQTVPELLGGYVPSVVDEIVKAYNGSALGKVAGAGGLNDALFDGLSSFKMDGQSIHIRKELLDAADTYNQFVVVYNDVVAEDNLNVDLKDLKKSLEKFLNNGIFKKVVCDTATQYVLNYETNEKLPEILDKALLKLQEKIKTPQADGKKFDMFEYISGDILKIVDVADKALSTGLAQEVKETEKFDIDTILSLAKQHKDDISQILSSVLDVGLVKDEFSVLADFASQKIADFFANEKDLDFGINSNIDPSTLSATITEAFEKLIDLNDNIIKISDLTKEDADITGTLLSLDSAKLVKLGETLDWLRELPILNYEKTVKEDEDAGKEGEVHNGAGEDATHDGQTEEGGEGSGKEKVVKVKVVDNLLKLYGVSLLGDKVWVEKEVEGGDGDEKQLSRVEISTYTDFFKFVSKPFDMVKDLELLSAEKLDFNTLIDKILLGLKGDEGQSIEANEAYVADLLLPFYQLEKASFADTSLKKMVFDEVISQLTTNLESMVSFDELATDRVEDENADKANIADWQSEFVKLGEVLVALDSGKVQVEDEGPTTLTYLEYVLEGKPIKTLLDTIVKEDGVLKSIFTPVFDSKIFAPLTEMVATELDNAVATLTGTSDIENAKPKTDFTGLRGDADKIASTLDTLQKLLSFATGTESFDSVQLDKIGQILDLLKTNARGDGTNRGVFDEVFAHLVWYITGDDITTEGKYTSKEYLQGKEFSEAKTIKNYLAVADAKTGYYDFESFEATFKELDETKTFLTSLKGKLGDSIDLSGVEGIGKFVKGFVDAIDEIDVSGADDADTAKAKVLENTKKLLDASGEEVWKAQDVESKKTEIQTAVKTQIANKVDNPQPKTAEALLKLLGIPEVSE